MRIFNFLKTNSEHRKSIRVKTSIGDKFINVKLGQTYESMDILSLKVFQKDIYRLFDADYGIIVGRVLGQGVGIPNAKVSVFIPIDLEQIDSPTTLEDIKKLETLAIYPYETVFDKDGNNKIYNLLPKYSKNRNFNGFPDNDYGIGATPKTPVGTFPEKEEVLVNETVAYLYENYLKFTTVTNESGDYILTVPANKTYTVNMSCDITDVGKFSTTPALLKLDGYPENYFSKDGTRMNDTIPLEILPNIDIQNQGITVKPLWTQNENNTNVGINRLDFNLVKKLKPYSTVIGSFFTQNKTAWWGDRIVFRMIMGIRSLCINLFGCNSINHIFNSDGAGTIQAGNFIQFYYGIRIAYNFDFDITIPLSQFSVANVVSFNDITIHVNLGCFYVTSFSNMPNFCHINVQDCCYPEFCIGFKVRYALPFFNFLFFQRRFCTLRGGKAEYEPWDLRFVRIPVCSRQDALSSLGGELTDTLFIQRHDKGLVDIRVFNIRDNITDQQCDTLNTLPVNPQDSYYKNFDINSGIELLPTTKYVKYINDGNFVVLLASNRKKVITNEEGDLIEVPIDSVVGVFTEFRGYFIMKHLDETNNPPTRDRSGKIILKIPQFFDYRRSFEQWVWKHYKFEYGEIYSVAQFNEVRYGKEDSAWEGTDDDILIPNTPKGWDEQTNILFVSAFQDLPTNLNIDVPYVPKPNLIPGALGNEQDPEYTTFYNHITYLGKDAPIEGINDTGSD